MLEILFVLTAVASVLFIFSVVLKKYIPVPLLHVWDIGFNNSYIYFPSLTYQVWFWATKFNII